jgi:hypothetical protein
MPDAQCTRGLVCSEINSASSHHRLTGSIRLSLHNGFDGSFVLSGDRALCHRRLADLRRIPTRLGG